MGETAQRTPGTADAAPERHRHGHRLKTVAELVEIAGQMKASTVIVAGGDRIEDLRLVESARDHGIVDRLILVGHKQRIDRSVRHLGIEILPDDVIDAENDEGVAAATVGRIREGGIDILLKGNISTPVLNRHMLGIVTRPTVSLVTIFDAAPILDGKPMILTDAGFTTVCNLGRMVDMVNNAVEVARLVMNIAKPRVAILSANEKQIQSLPSTWIGAKLSERKWPDAVVYGPLSFDLATDPGSVAVKGLPDRPGAGEVAGQADVLVCPGIDAANIIYKAITAMVKYGQASSASVTLGFSVPYIIISRADPLSVRLESIALCSIYSQQRTLNERARREGGAPVKAGAGEARTRYVLALAPDSGGFRVSAIASDGRARSARLPGGSASFPGGGAALPAGETAAPRARELLFEILDGWKGLSFEAVVAGSGKGGAGDAGGAPGEGEIRPLGESSAGGRRSAERPAAGPAVTAAELAAAAAERLSVPAFEAGVSPGGVAGILAAKAGAAVGRPAEDMNFVLVEAGRGFAVRAVCGGKVVDTVSIDDYTARTRSGATSRDDRSLESTLYEIAKGVGAMFAALDCDVETILLAGDLLSGEEAGRTLRRRIGRLAPVTVVEGDPELEDLARRTRGAVEGHPPGGSTKREKPT